MSPFLERELGPSWRQTTPTTTTSTRQVKLRGYYRHLATFVTAITCTLLLGQLYRTRESIQDNFLRKWHSAHFDGVAWRQADGPDLLNVAVLDRSVTAHDGEAVRTHVYTRGERGRRVDCVDLLPFLFLLNRTKQRSSVPSSTPYPK